MVVYWSLAAIVAERFIDIPDNKSDVDHVDLNQQNNCISNLRWCSKSASQMNTGKRQSCSSMSKGVFFEKRNQKWRAVVRQDLERMNIGYFASELDAAIAYNEHAERRFGAFATIYFNYTIIL